MRRFSAWVASIVRCRWAMAAVLAGILLQLLVGCLDGRKSVAIRYDAARDEFAFLTIYHDIRVSSQTYSGTAETQNADPTPADTQMELQRLAALYRNRDHLMIGPFALDLLSGETQFLRVSDTQAARIDLSQTGDMQTMDVPFHLNDVRILPGELFLIGDGNLCYYHLIVLPGGVVDGVIAMVNDHAAQWIKENVKEVFDSLDAELAQRKGGEQPLAWDAFSTQAIALMLKQIDGAAGEDAHLNPLDTASMQGLRDALAAGQLKIFRRGGLLALRVPLSRRDVTGVTAFFPALQKALQKKATEPLKADTAAELSQLNLAMSSVGISAADPTTLELTLDVVKFAQAMREPATQANDLNARNRVDAKEMARMAQQQLEVNKGLSVEKIEAAFAAGTLAAHPSKTPVKPGTDLGDIKAPAPATQN